MNNMADNNNNINNTINAIVEEIEIYLSETQQIYFKWEKHISEYKLDSLNNMGFDNCVGNADFYTLMCEVYDGNKDKAKKAFEYSYKYIMDCFNRVEAYKPIAICTWKGVDADLWLPLHKAYILMENRLKPTLEEYFF